MPQASSSSSRNKTCIYSNNSSTLPMTPSATMQAQGGPHVRHHHHKYCWDRSDYRSYAQNLARARLYQEPWALEDDVRGELRYKPPPHNPDPWYRHRTWWREPGIRPWEHEDLLHHSRPMRNAGFFNPWVVSNSGNAPWATYDNEPLQDETRPIVIPPWEKDEHVHMESDGFCGGHVDAGSELLKKVHKLPWELDFDANLHPKEPRVFNLKYPDNKWNEKPWNRKPGETRFRPMSPPPPKPPIIRENTAFAAPFATKHNQVVVKYGEGKPSQCNNLHRRRQRCPKPFEETHWPFERHEYDPQGKLPRQFLSFPRDPSTFEPWPFPHADEHKVKGQQHCELKEGHKSKVKFYPGDPTKKAAAGDFGRVVYPPKIISYPRDPATYVPFPTHYAYEQENKDQKHCDLKQGHDRGWKFYPGDPSKMPPAGQKVPPKVFPATWDINAPYFYH